MTDRWYSAHVYYYEPDKDGLLLDGVRPLLDELDGLGDAAHGVHVLRHWRQGPHVRVNLRAEPETWENVVRPRIDQVIGAYLIDHPSTARVDLDQMLARHRLLAEREKERGPLTPLCPDNAIRYAPFDSRAHVLGERGAALLADYYADANDLLFAMLDHVRTGHDDKEALALSLMLTVSHTMLGPITRSFVSYRSHAEGFIAQCADPEAVRAGFDRRFRERAEELTERVRSVIRTLDEAREPSRVAFVREWRSLVEEYARRARPLTSDDEFISPGRVERMRDRPNLSAFHRTMFATDEYHRRYLSSPEFLLYRVLLNFTYLHVTRLGLTPLERMRACHLAANAVEEVYSVSAVDMIERYTARQLVKEGRA